MKWITCDMNNVKKNLTDDDVNMVMSDVCRRLMYHPAMKEIDGDDIVRVDTVDTERRMFHVLNGDPYEWMSFNKYLPLLFRRRDMGYNYLINGKLVDVFKKISDVTGGGIDMFNTSSGILMRIVDNTEYVDKILKAIDVLDMSFVDCNKLIDDGLAYDVLSINMNENPYK